MVRFRCSKSCVLKTRAMAARALVPLVSGVALQHMLTNLIEDLPQTSKQRLVGNFIIEQCFVLVNYGAASG